eukprot:scaffold87046_cov30-Attheya_sp.AAC.4
MGTLTAQSMMPAAAGPNCAEESHHSHPTEASHPSRPPVPPSWPPLTYTTVPTTTTTILTTDHGHVTTASVSSSGGDDGEPIRMDLDHPHGGLCYATLAYLLAYDSSRSRSAGLDLLNLLLGRVAI